MVISIDVIEKIFCSYASHSTTSTAPTSQKPNKVSTSWQLFDASGQAVYVSSPLYSLTSHLSTVSHCNCKMKQTHSSSCLFCLCIHPDLVSVRQRCVSLVFRAPVGSSRKRQEWTWALTPSDRTSGCSVDTDERYRGPEDGSACQVLRQTT